MEREDIIVLAQLLTGIKDSLSKLEDAYKRGDAERLARVKQEILNFQRQIDRLI